MKKFKRLFFAFLIVFIVVPLSCCNDVQLVDDETIKLILSTETKLDGILLALKNEAEGSGLEIREINIRYDGMTDIVDRNGICTLIAYKEYEEVIGDVLYEGGKVELESISFLIKTHEFIHNEAKMEHGRAVVIGSKQLEIEKWAGEIEGMVDLFIYNYINELQTLKSPIITFTISNDKGVLNMRDGNTVFITEEFSMISG